MVSVAASGQARWQACANVGWLDVSEAGGTGVGTLVYTVSPYDEVNTRQGTLSVAGNTFTVFQTGKPMKLSECSVAQDFHSATIPIRVTALAATEWHVTPNEDWIGVLDSGPGKGSG